MSLRALADLSTAELRDLVAIDRPPVVVLVPCGSMEPHGPHLPLSTDTIISEAAIEQAATRLADRATVLVAPSVAYGVTEYARSFCGAISIPAETLTRYLRAIVDGLHAHGVRHVCLVNNHLEPAQDAAVRAAISDLPKESASVACPLDRRWARLLSDEFKRGECHAGQYETSLVLAASPSRVNEAERVGLAAVPISLSKQIKAGVYEFVQMGMLDAYAGAPALATPEEGRALIKILGEMIATEILEAMRLGGASNA